MTTPPKPPTNRWRVKVGDGEPKGFRSQNKAYEFVREQIPRGHRIVVRQWWENGQWVLYEVFDAAPPDDSPDADERLADN